MLPLFSDLAEIDDVADDCVFLRPPVINKVKISASVEASHVQCVKIEDLTENKFSEDFRCQKPVLIRNGASCWSATQDWSDVDKLIQVVGDVESTVLVAKDGRNFLKNGLCYEINCSLNQILRVGSIS